MTAEEKKEEQQEEENNNSILDEEIDSWKEHFGYALREENSILFNKMLSQCLTDEQYAKAVNTKGENYSIESLLFMALILCC
jgi:hypothetical protein